MEITRIKEFEALLELALREDFDELGDITSDAVFGEETCTARLVSKDEGILAGASCFRAAFSRIDPKSSVEFLVPDGSRLRPGDFVASVKGRTRLLLAGERTALNFLSFLSGIATMTNAFVTAAASSGKTIILDTRKTLPGYRRLSKYAVKVGGGENHRMGLYDMVMIKDNHIDAAGSIRSAVERIRSRWGGRFRIEVECRGLEEVDEAIALGVDVIMLDNMDSATAAEALRKRKGEVLFESSGDMSLERVAEYARIGVDYISVGKLTHSVRSFNFSLLMAKN